MPQEVTDAFYQVRKKVGDISSELPQGLLGPYFNDEFGDTFITLHSISGDGYSYPELKKFAIQARDMLLTTPGVEKAVIIGDQPEKIYIDVSSKALAERGLTLTDLQNAIKGQNNVDPAGSVDTGLRSVRISVEGDVTKAADIRELRLRAGGQVTRLGDIATVTSGLEDPYQRKYRFNGHDSVQVGVVMAKGFNVTDVGKAVEATYKRFEEALPYGVAVDQISDQPEVVTDAVSEFMEALGEALLIVLVVSFLSIGWRSGLVIAIAIPLVLAATFAIMYELGIDLQRISLGALIIALGLLVDDAMIVVEMMERKLEEGLVKIEAASFAYSSTAFPMLTGTLITTAGFIPVGFAASTAGEYVRTLFYVVGIALVVSWFVAVYFTPWLGYMILKQRTACRRASRRLRHRLLPPAARHGRLGGAPPHHRAGADAGHLRHQPVGVPVHPAEFLPAIVAAGNPRRSLAARRHQHQGSRDAGQGARSQDDGRHGQAVHRHLYRRRRAALLPAARPAAAQSELRPACWSWPMTSRRASG